jgi:hypothetical protein
VVGSRQFTIVDVLWHKRIRRDVADGVSGPAVEESQAQAIVRFEGGTSLGATLTFAPVDGEILLVGVNVFDSEVPVFVGTPEIAPTGRPRTSADFGLPSGTRRPRAIGVRQLHDLPIHAAEREVREKYLAPRRGSLKLLPGAWATNAVRRPGRKGRDDLHYAQLAALYVELCKRGSRAPVKQLAAQQYLNQATIRNQLTEARNRGLLTRKKQGQTGGALTQKARRLLDGTR